MSTVDSCYTPNDWCVTGAVDTAQQAAWYEEMFRKAGNRAFVQGFCLWDWPWKQYPIERAAEDRGYNVYGKPAEEVVRTFYQGKV